MYLAVEIGGTKLQVGVGSGDGSPPDELQRLDVPAGAQARDILALLEPVLRRLAGQYHVQAAGIGFGGPVDAQAGRTVVSHQVEGWREFPLVGWFAERTGLHAVLGNDSDLAGLAEARFGAGQGRRVVFYSNAGSGIGGSLVIDDRLYQGSQGIASEVGHLRPGLGADSADQTVESLASGWAIAEAARAQLGGPVSHPLGNLTGGSRPLGPETLRQRLIDAEEEFERCAANLLDRCEGEPEQLNAAVVAEAAREDNQLAREIFDHAAQAYGWALAQVITLVSPEVVVLGGGVAQAGEELWLAPVRKYVDRYVFPPLRETFQVLPAALGELVVVHGALALAAEWAAQRSTK